MPIFYFSRKCSTIHDSVFGAVFPAQSRKFGCALFCVMGCFLFPTYNFTKTYPNDSHWYSVYLSVMWCLIMGAFLSQAFPYKKGCLLKTTPMLMAFNSLYILAGMGCRYLLEFGEVSNTYNFTAPNMIVHVLLINILCLACWHLAAKMPRKKSDNIFP